MSINTQSHLCSICGLAEPELGIDLGLQVASNQFLKKTEREDRYPLALGQCPSCATVQLVKRMPVEVLRPRVDWLKYSEPEDHLDELVRRVALHLKSSAASICGLSYKDDSTLERLKKSSCGQIYRLDPKTDLGIQLPGAGVETIQGELSAKRISEVTAKHGIQDLLIVRHMLEHVYDLNTFFAALKALANAEALFVFEVPDCRKAFEQGDYPIIWEEHLYYFTQQTLRAALSAAGFEILELYSHPYAFEDSLLAICRRGKVSQISAVSPAMEAELSIAKKFFNNFPGKSRKLRERLSALRAADGKIALFGAGHLASAFVCYHGLEDLFDCVVDDNPHKQGLLLPGTQLMIESSAVLARDEIKVCVLGINLSAEEKILAAQKQFIANGGQFFSMFAGSQRALMI